jgi:hypothetical protein
MPAHGGDPRLPAGSLDAAVPIHMYHEIAQPYALLFNLAAAIKPESAIGIVNPHRPTDEHGIRRLASSAAVRAE